MGGWVGRRLGVGGGGGGQRGGAAHEIVETKIRMIKQLIC